MFLDPVEDMDMLLACHEGFLQGPWLERAKQDEEQQTQFEWNARTQITMGYYDNTGGSKSSSRLREQVMEWSSKRLLWSSGSYTFQILNKEFGKWPRFPVLEGLEKIMDKASKQLAEKSEDIPGGKQRRCTEQIPVALLQIQ
uniref:Alpha-N-acetylglucosaminidase C-terminal domain-containing protein n=2 Tax=Populus TaxID=3689 RepID=A0A4U5QZM1_POPAL|nr:hypothetical protein D5086_0000026220 [Populus alba]